MGEGSDVKRICIFIIYALHCVPSENICMHYIATLLLFFGGGHIKKEIKKKTWAIGQVALRFILTLFLVSAVYLDELISLSH